MAFLLVSCVVGLLLCEGVLRTFVQIGSFRWVSDDDLHWNQKDADRDYALTPGYTGRVEAPEFVHPVRINDLGFRGPEPQTDGRPIFLIGDSFVFGVGAGPQETLAARLAAAWRTRRPEAEVWNLGVPSYSSPQYRQTLELYRRHAQPSHIVVCLYLGHTPSDANDLWGAASFEQRREARPTDEAEAATNSSGTKPEAGPRPSPRRIGRKIVKRLQQRSALYAFVTSRLASRIRAWRHARHELEAHERAHLERGWTILRRDLEAIRRIAEEEEARLLVVHIPEASSVTGEDWRMLEPLRLLTDDLGLSLLDFRSTFSPSDGVALYYLRDGHLNPEGYRRVAEKIAEALLDPNAEAQGVAKP